MKTRPPSPTIRQPKCRQAWPTPPAVGRVGTCHVTSIGPGSVPHSTVSYHIVLFPSVDALPPGVLLTLVWQNAFLDPPVTAFNGQSNTYVLDAAFLQKFTGVGITYQGVTYGTIYATGPP